jgi:hypothetical protein
MRNAPEGFALSSRPSVKMADSLRLDLRRIANPHFDAGMAQELGLTSEHSCAKFRLTTCTTSAMCVMRFQQGVNGKDFVDARRIRKTTA